MTTYNKTTVPTKPAIVVKPMLTPVCNCLLGILDDKPIYDNIFLVRLKDLSEMMPTFKNYGLMTGKCLSPKEIADGRKGYLQRYNYCPKCDIRINWKVLLNRL
jgi:hypothetical protein